VPVKNKKWKITKESLCEPTAIKEFKEIQDSSSS
jgi:hypothetical protein